MAQNNQHNSTGLFSSVFGYITREVQDFMVSATGGDHTAQVCRPHQTRFPFN
jgi:hypothetical protein